MSNRRATALVAYLWVLGGIGAGCNKDTASVTGPSPAPLTIMSVHPKEGLAGVAMPVEILGSGFLPGAVVTMDGSATEVQVLNTSTISAKTPVHAPGRVDVVVTNPNGQSVRFSGGYVFSVVTLTVSPGVVTPGSQVNVSWMAPGRSGPDVDGDWVGLFRPGDPNTDPLWSQYTTGAKGTLAFSAPLQPGEYEFRYLLSHEYVDLARCPVTVTAGGL